MSVLPSKRPKDIKSQAVREAILSVALELFTSKGYFNTSVHDIRRQANVSIGAIYHHFDSKEAIAQALYSSLLENVTQTFDDILIRHTTTYDRCRAVMICLFELTDSHPSAMEFMLYAKHREFIPTALPICSSRPLSLMRKFVREGISNGELLEMDPVVATTCLFGGMFRMINLRLDGVFDQPLVSYLDAVWTCGWRGVAKNSA